MEFAVLLQNTTCHCCLVTRLVVLIHCTKLFDTIRNLIFLCSTKNSTDVSKMSSWWVIFKESFYLIINWSLTESSFTVISEQSLTCVGVINGSCLWSSLFVEISRSQTSYWTYFLKRSIWLLSYLKLAFQLRNLTITSFVKSFAWYMTPIIAITLSISSGHYDLVH